jgi:hypothetical protein
MRIFYPEVNLCYFHPPRVMIHHNFNAEDVTENTEFEEKKSMSKHQHMRVRQRQDDLLLLCGPDSASSGCWVSRGRWAGCKKKHGGAQSSRIRLLGRRFSRFTVGGRAGHSLLFTLFANRYSATSMYHFAIATPLLFRILQNAIRYSLRYFL